MVKKYAMSVLNKKPNHVLLRYAAIYMFYALYFKQPCRPLVKIRLTLDQFRDLQETVAEAKKDKHHDVVYAWAKLFTISAFHYVVADTQMGLEVGETRSRLRQFLASNRLNMIGHVTGQDKVVLGKVWTLGMKTKVVQNVFKEQD